jgi:hypothetical protein
VSDLRIDRLPRLPAACESPTANTPIDNFEVFTRTWAEHYISLDLKHTDWDRIVRDNRPKVTARTTPVQLFEVLEAMIKPFDDLHAGIAAPKLKRETKEFWRPGSDRVIKGGVDRFASRGRRILFAVTDRAYLHGPLRKFCRGKLQFGHGSDELGLAISSRLAAVEYLAYTKQARFDPVDRDKWTTGDRILVRPSARPGFRGQVVQLIGPITMSGAETFTQALMERTPHVTRIGENTQGVFSDVLDRKLPNGWSFGLPNEVYRTPKGTTFDGIGIPPDIEVAVYADEDVSAGRDPGIAKALQVLSKSQ